MPTESRFALRLPTDLYDLVRGEAEEKGKSINEYIVFVLSDYHNLKGDMDRRISAIEAKLASTTSAPVPD